MIKLALSGFAVAVFSAAFVVEATAAFPANTLSCDGFMKRADGTWAARPGIRSFDIGEARGVTVSNIVIPPGLMVIQGVDVWELLNAKCG